MGVPDAMDTGPTRRTGALGRIATVLKSTMTQGSQRSLEAKRNILASFAIKIFSVGISLILVPLTIHYVDPAQYGIWLTLSSIVAWFGFFDIGFGNGLRNRFAEAKATGQMEKARIYVSTTYAALAATFLVVWGLALAINPFLDWSRLLNAPAELANELSILAQVVFTFFCAQVVLQTIRTVLIADQKPARSAFIETLGQFIVLVAIFTLTRTTSGSLLHLGVALGAIPILVLLVASLWFYRGEYRSFAPSWRLARMSHAKDIMKLGVQFFVIQIAAIVIYQTTNIVIAQVAGPTQVTVYNIAFKYLGVATMLFGIVMAPFWSAFTDAFASNDFGWMQAAEAKLRNAAFLVMGFVVLMVACSPWVYHLWVGEAVQVPWSVSVMVGLYVITNVWNTFNSLLLNGMGKIRLQLIVSLFGTVVNVPVAVLLGHSYGIEGVVLSSVLLNLISAVYAPIQVRKLLNQRASGIWNA